MKKTAAVIPLAVDAALKAEIVRVAKRTGTSQAEAMRQALRFGLPLLELPLAIKKWCARQRRGKA